MFFRIYKCLRCRQKDKICSSLPAQLDHLPERSFLQLNTSEMVMFIYLCGEKKKLLNLSHFQNRPLFSSFPSPRCSSVRLSGFNNRSASCNLVRWTFYLSAETKLSLSSSFRPANVIECCVLTAKVIICALVRAISLVPITSQPDRMSLHTPKLYLCYLLVCVVQLLREAFGQIFVPKKSEK